MTNAFQREKCALLGSQIYSDCDERRMRRRLTSKRVPSLPIDQRLIVLACRGRIIVAGNNIDDEDLNCLRDSVISDKDYFQRLSYALNRHSFLDLKHLSERRERN